ncbi:hypothetical protein LCGC14_2065160, partial [marine sediment metagenome]
WLELESNTGVGWYTGSYALTDPYIDNGTDQVRIRFQSTLTTTNFDMELDQIVVKYIDHYLISKKHNASISEYMYMQTNITETLSLRSTDYIIHYNLYAGDYFIIDFQTSSTNQIDLILLKDGVQQDSYVVSQSGNTNFLRRTVEIGVDTDVEFDQLMFSGTFEDTKYFMSWDIKTYSYTLTGDYADFYVDPDGSHDMFLQADTYNLRIFEEGIKIDEATIVLHYDNLTQYVHYKTQKYILKIYHNAYEQSDIEIFNGTTSISNNTAIKDEILEIILDEGEYTVNWTNGETGITTTYNIVLDENQILLLSSTYNTIYFGLYQYNGLSLNYDLVRFYINSERRDFGINLIKSSTADLLVLDYFNNTLASETIDASIYSEYNIIITVFELQIRHLAQGNSNISISDTISHNFINFSMAPDTLNKYVLANSIYNVTWWNGENNEIIVYDITLNADYILTLNTTYYDIYFSLFDLNLHIIDPNQYVFRLNGTREALGFIEYLETDDYTITIVDRFGTSLFNSVVNIRGLNEYVINITLYELQIRHLALENSNLTLSETTTHNSLNFSMSPNSLRSFILGSSTYNVTWVNGENSITATYDINLNVDYILTLNTTYYSTYFSLYDQNGVRLDDSLFSLYLNGTRKDFGFVVLETNSTLILVQDFLNVTVFNQVIALSGLNEYNIIITIFELQIRHLARISSNVSIS